MASLSFGIDHVSSFFRDRLFVWHGGYVDKEFRRSYKEVNQDRNVLLYEGCFSKLQIKYCSLPRDIKLRYLERLSKLENIPI